MNEQEAQKFLAEQLKEKIQIRIGGDCELPNDTVFFFWEKGYEIRDTEWDSIARLVEAKLTEVQKREYVFKLFSQFSEDDDWDAASTRLVFFPMVSADYVQRATALKETQARI